MKKPIATFFFPEARNNYDVYFESLRIFGMKQTWRGDLSPDFLCDRAADQ